MELLKLKENMDAKGMRSETVAEKTGLSIDTVRNAKRGKSISLSTATAIANALGVTVDGLQ